MRDTFTFLVAEPTQTYTITSTTPCSDPCQPRCLHANIRDAVEYGDFIFVVSGKTSGVQQYVVGGLQVEEKISAWQHMIDSQKIAFE